MKKAKFETVHKNSDDEMKNFEDETWKLTEGRTKKLDLVSNSFRLHEPKLKQLKKLSILTCSTPTEEPRLENFIGLNSVKEVFLCCDEKVCLLQFKLHCFPRILFNVVLIRENKKVAPDSVTSVLYKGFLEVLQKNTSEKNRFIDPAVVVRLFCNKRTDTIREAINPISSVYKLDMKPSYKQLSEHPMQTTKSLLAETPNFSKTKFSAMDAADFTALDISSVPLQSGKTDMGMKITQPDAGTWRAKDEAEKEFQWGHKTSHLKHTWPNLKAENEYSHGHDIRLLLLLTFLSITTFLTALKIVGCKSEEGYKNDSSLNPTCQIVNQYPDFIQLFIAFNTLVFFLSVAWMLTIFNRLPLGPLLQVSSFSMLGAYMCIISGPSKPPSSYSTQNSMSSGS